MKSKNAAENTDFKNSVYWIMITCKCWEGGIESVGISGCIAWRHLEMRFEMMM